MLTTEQEIKIQRAIIDNRPERLKIDFCLWHRAAPMQLIEQEYGIKLPLRTAGKHLNCWRFQTTRADQKDLRKRPETVKAWLDEHYSYCQSQGLENLLGDETIITNTDVRGRSCSPAGQTATYGLCGEREKLSMIATATNQGKARWMLIDEAFNAD